MELQVVAKELSIDEGFSAIVYLCSKGAPTIGYGRNIRDNPLTVEERIYLNHNEVGYNNLVISKAQGYYLLERDINHTVKRLQKVFPNFLTEYPDEVQHILINICFQIGAGSFKGFTEMINAVKNKDYKKAAIELRDSELWRKDTPERTERRAKRFEALLG